MRSYITASMQDPGSKRVSLGWPHSHDGQLRGARLCCADRSVIFLLYLLQLRADGFSAGWHELAWQVAFALTAVFVMALTVSLFAFWNRMSVSQRWKLVWTIIIV